MLVLTGPGGIGKTRLGLQVAAELLQDFPSGVCFVSLASVSDPALVAPTIFHTLGLRENARESVVDQLKGYLREQHLLLLLDNFRAGRSGCSVAHRSIGCLPKAKLLVSGPVELHVHGEHEYVVPPLSLPEQELPPGNETLSQYAAITLFLQCARTLKPEFQITSTNAHAIVEICVRLEGVPLAVELAAVRIQTSSPQVLLARLGHRLQFLTNGPKDVPVRQQTLRNTLAWSYDLLNSWEQWLFRQLCVFVGGCTLEAAEAVCAVLGSDDGHRARVSIRWVGFSYRQEPSVSDGAGGVALCDAGNDPRIWTRGSRLK